MAVSKEQIKDLLSSGVSPTDTAAAVGCDVSYISQLLSDDRFAEEVAIKKTASLTAHARRDATIDGIEDKLLSQLNDMVDNSAFYKPRDVLHAMAVINKAIRRGPSIGVGATGTVVNNIIQLQMPEHVVRRFTTNRINEVVEVEAEDGKAQTLVTMPAHQLLRTLVANKGDDDGASEKYKESLKYLPSGTTVTVRGDS